MRFLNFLNKIITYSIRKAKAIQYYINLKQEKKKWDKYFKTEKEICYKLENNCKLFLERNNRLTEFIIFKKFEANELKFIELFLNKGDIFLDIGANIGLHSLYAAKKVGEDGTVYSFEPTPTTFTKLKKNIKINNFDNVKLLNFGFSDTKKQLFINTSNTYNAWNTFADPKKTISPQMFNNKVSVDVEKLDTWLENQKIKIAEISLIKIDVEGWEKFVLLGAKKILSSKNAPVILIEFDENNTWAAGYSCHELYDLLNSFGYKLYTFDLKNMEFQLEPKQLHYPSQNLIAIKNYNLSINKLKYEKK